LEAGLSHPFVVFINISRISADLPHGLEEEVKPVREGGASESAIVRGDGQVNILQLQPASWFQRIMGLLNQPLFVSKGFD
jgi:hypothetical protein